jgi:hypothetical protein
MGARGAGSWQGGWNRDAVVGRPRAGAALAAARGEITVHYDDDPGSGDHPDVEIGAGVKVRHQQFGTGEVRACHPSGSGLKVTVAFPKVGTKTVLARFLERW